MEKKKNIIITIIGAGLAGCFLAILLAKRGYKVALYERLSKDEIANSSSKRSFNLTFYNYGMEALKKAGVWEVVKPYLIHLKGSVTQISKNSAPIFVRFDYNNMPYFAIQRAKLLETLLKEVTRLSLVSIHFDTKLVSINRQDKTMLIQNTKSKEYKTIATDIILGADGANSQVRSFMQQGQVSHHIQEYIPYEYKQIIITGEMAEKIKLLKDTQHAWTRKYATFIAFPNGDESFTAMLILPKNNERGFASLTNDRQIENFFNETFPNFIPALSEMKQAIIENPKGSFVTVFTNPWYYKDFMAIFGDAAHACLPFYGIGMSVAFGDCMEFVDLLDKHGEDWNEIFSRYQKARKNHTDIIGNLAKESFVRFRRHKKADYVAIYDRFETLLHTILPKVFRPPLFHLVANNPNNTVEFFQKHNQQRKTARFLGIPILVHTLAKAIELKEKLIKKT